MNVSFIEFLSKNNVIRLGEFRLKNGRIAPYFIDMGVLNNGTEMSELGRYYAEKIKENFGDNFDIIFGPAYKAIPLAISTSIALANSGVNKKWLFDRKEVKLHGADANMMFVGNHGIDHDAKVILVDDVLTSGETKIEAINKLQKSLKAEVIGIVIAVDRMEVGNRDSAVEEFTRQTGVPVHSIVTIADIFSHLKSVQVNGKSIIDEEIYATYQNYMKKYGVKNW